MSMKITDYVKLEEIKGLLVFQLKALGLLEQAQVMEDKDLNTMIDAMAQLNIELKKFKTYEEREDYLIAYIVGLWGRLVIDYGASIEAL